MRELAEGRDGTLREARNLANPFIADVVVGKNIRCVPESGEVLDCRVDYIVGKGLGVSECQYTALKLVFDSREWGRWARGWW